MSGDYCNINPKGRQGKIRDTVKCLTKFFGLNPTVNIMLSEFKDFIQNFDKIIFKV